MPAEDCIYTDSEYAKHSYRVDIMKSLLVELFRPGKNKKGEVIPEDNQHKVLRNSVMALLEIMAKYQDPDDDWDAEQDMQTIEQDMKKLLVYSVPVAMGGARMKAHAARYHAMGRKGGAEALLQEKSRVENVEKKKFVVAAAEPLREKAKGEMYINESRMQANSDALMQLAAHADKLCNVLKKIHDRMLKEYAFSGGA